MMGPAHTEHLGAYCLQGDKWGTRAFTGAQGQALPVAWQRAHFFAHHSPHLKVDKAQQKGPKTGHPK